MAASGTATAAPRLARPEPFDAPAPPLAGLDLRRSYGDGEGRVDALRGVGLTLRRGEFAAVMGPSGSGKSTLLHLLGTLDRPDAGQVLLDGEPVAGLDDRELALLRRRRIGFVLQFFSLLPTLDAHENVAFPLLLDGVPDAGARALEALTGVGLAHRARHRPSELSGGEQQRVALARALVTNPAVVLADEPTGNLDTDTGREVLELLRDAAERGETILMVTHDPQAAELADRVIRLRDGRLSDR